MLPGNVPIFGIPRSRNSENPGDLLTSGAYYREIVDTAAALSNIFCTGRSARRAIPTGSRVSLERSPSRERRDVITCRPDRTGNGATFVFSQLLPIDSCAGISTGRNTRGEASSHYVAISANIRLLAFARARTRTCLRGRPLRESPVADAARRHVQLVAASPWSERFLFRRCEQDSAPPRTTLLFIAADKTRNAPSISTIWLSREQLPLRYRPIAST